MQMIIFLLARLKTKALHFVDDKSCKKVSVVHVCISVECFGTTHAHCTALDV